MNDAKAPMAGRIALALELHKRYPLATLERLAKEFAIPLKQLQKAASDDRHSQ